MEFIKDLNIVEILKSGSIGLGFLLVLMSYYLIRKEQENKIPNKTISNITIIFMLFSSIIMVLGILSEIIKTKSSLNIRLGNNEMKINELTYSSLNSIDTKEYYINSDFGFALKKPNKNWTNIKCEIGVDGILKIFPTKSKIFNKANIEESLKQNPLGALFRNATHYYFDNSESRTTISLTESSGNDIINDLILKRGEMLMNIDRNLGYDINNFDYKKRLMREISEFREDLIGFDTFVAKESFVLSIYPKDSLPDYLKELKLPGFYTSYTISLGSYTDKLVANEKQILAGAEMNLNNIKLKNCISNFQNKKWIMFTENEKFFFVIEISYSPQISSSVDLWDNLQDELNSFTLLVEK